MRIIDPTEISDVQNSYPLFFQPSYAKYELSKGWQLQIISDDEGAAIPLRTRKTYFIKQAQYLYPPVKNGKRLEPVQERTFLDELLVFCRRSGVCDFISPPQHYSVFESLPRHSYYTEIGIITLNLQKSEEELLGGFASSCRNKIKKAINAGLTVKFGTEYFDTFYELYKGIHDKQGIYYDSKQDLEKMLNNLDKEQYIIAVTVKDEDILGAALVLLNGAEAYYYHSGTIADCPFQGVNNLLQYRLFQYMQELGVKRYCMGGCRLGEIKGTKYEGIQTFKLSFGAEIEKGYHFFSEITWRYKVYKTLLKYYLAARGIKENRTGLDFKYN